MRTFLGLVLGSSLFWLLVGIVLVLGVAWWLA